MKKTSLILFLLFISHQAIGEHFSSSAGVSRQSTEGVESRILPNLVTFYSTLGIAPSLDLSRVSPNATDTQDLTRKWKANTETWSALTEQRLKSLNQILSEKSSDENQPFKKGLTQIRQQLTEGVSRASLNSTGDSNDPLGSLGGRVVSPEAQKISDEILDMLIEFGTAFSKQPSENRQQALRAAHRAVKTSFPLSNLTRYTARDLKGLNAHHRTQVTELLRLRDSLYSNGNFLPLVTEMSEANRQPIGLGRAASIP